MKIVTRIVLIVFTAVIALTMTGCGSGQSDPFTYFKASNTEASDEFGRAVALSDDGTTLAVGANLEDSDGVTPPIQSNNSESAAGAVYIFTSVGGWQQQAYVKASSPSPAADDWFGFSVALSSDGNTLAVGAPYYGASNTGAVYVYTRSGSTWTFKRQITGVAANDGLGWAVALSNNGSVLAAGAPFESTTAGSSGALYVYTTSDGWSTIGTPDTLKSSSVTANAQLGISIALNGSGTVLAAGANQISSAGPGFAKIFLPTGGSNDWATNTGYSERTVAATGGETNDQFGVAVSLNSAGDMLAVGAWQEDSNTISDTANNGAADSGAAYVFVTSDNWVSAPTETYVKAASPAANDNFGTSVSLNGSGNTLNVGAPAPAPALKAGTVYRIVNNGTWAGGIASEKIITSPSGDNGDQFGFSVFSGSTGTGLAIGVKDEDSAATGVNGVRTDNTKADSGAAYIYAP